MIYDTGTQVQTTDFADPVATEKACVRLEKDLKTAPSSCVLCFLSRHADDENTHIFGVMKSYEPEMVSTLLKEHEEIEKEMDAILKASKDLQTTTNREARITKGLELNRMLNGFFAYYITHMNKEEATILPATQKYLTDEQLGSIRAKVTMSLPPDRAPILLGWIIKSLNVNEGADILRDMKRTTPPPVFENILKLAEQNMGQERFNQLKTML